jgi:phospholipid/cholesterol/gamma-HCH transport system ATP-binding protein
VNSDVIIEVNHLEARYEDSIVLDDVTFEVLNGEILGILGGSGCGKTTLLRHMVGLLRPFAGSVIIDGVDITTCESDSFRQTLRKIGVLFQSAALFGSMTLVDNVILPIAEYGGLSPLATETMARMKLELVGLAGYENHLPSELSGGMKKRAGLARSLALNPKILFLDEPSAGLDPIISAEIDDLILHINRTIGTTIIIVTHELESVFNVAKRVIMLDKSVKGIRAEGDPHRLRNFSPDPLVQQFFHRKPSRPEIAERPD